MGLLHVIPDGLEWKLQVYAIPEAEIVLHQIRDHSDAESSIKSVYFFFSFCGLSYVLCKECLEYR